MPEKVRTARMALVVAACLMFATAALFLFIFISGSAMIGLSGERRELVGSALLGGLGAAMTVLAVALGAAVIAASVGIGRRRPWARVLGLGLGILILPAVPVGTFLGVLAVTGLLGADAGEWFGERPTGTLSRSFPDRNSYGPRA